MLEKYDLKLSELREKMLRRGKVESMQAELRRQQAELSAREDELWRELECKQADVDRLTGGFWSIYYAIIGKKEDMLENERAEVLKASVKYETARNERKRVEEQIEQLEWDRRDMENAEVRYCETLDEKLEAMRTLGIEAERIVSIEEEKHLFEAKLCEVNEAATAGRRVIGQLETIEMELTEAENYGRADMFGASKLITQAGKYVHLDNAQRAMQKMERFVSEFQAELADVMLKTDVSMEVDGFARFADYFFDGLFVDWMVLTRIQKSKSSVRSAHVHVQRVLDCLGKMKWEIEREISRLQGELHDIAENTK